MPSPTPSQLTVLTHPLVQHKIALLRDRGTSTRDFKELVAELGMFLAYEGTRDVPTTEITVETPLERTTGRQVDGKSIVLVPILRAGLGLVEGITRLLPTARVGHIGLYRDHDTLAPHQYYMKLPPAGPAARWLVLDPMLATGGSAVAAVQKLKEAGAKDIRFLCLVAAPEGVAALSAAHPDVPIIAAALDRQLNAQGYILPGLGDAGDRLFGTT
ncbi:MAG TPA: uracil phosphoribosyltransferase [Gemmatimonadales bacterium]|jgi:uracil phosphoribosyltransferase|nr:uracil phosphoribosyltransferase [Gemmatimonadales bacterium]